MWTDLAEVWSALRDAVYNHNFSAAAEAVLECAEEPVISQYIKDNFDRDEVLKSFFDDEVDLSAAAFTVFVDIWRHPVGARGIPGWSTPCEGSWHERAGSGDHQYWYGHAAGLTSDIDTLYFCPNWLSGSDYSGGVMTRSNFDVFMGEFGELEGIETRYGGYASYWVCIRLDLLFTHEGIREMLESLEGYPILDEDAYSEAQIDAQEEAWGNWVRYEFIREIEKKLDIELEEPENDAEEEERFEDNLYTCFREAMEAANEYWEDDNEGVNLRVSEVVKEVGLAELGAHSIPYEKLYDEEEPPFVDPNQLPLPGFSSATSSPVQPDAPPS
jgi:hypothetical protein